MHNNSRAPLLSATLSTDSCWIMSARLLQHFGHAPAGFLGDRAGFDDANAVADAAGVLLVVHLEPRGVTDDLLVQGMRLEDLHHHDHRLLHLVAHDDTVAHLAARARRWGRVTHRLPPHRRWWRRRSPPRAPGTRPPGPPRERQRAPGGAARASAWVLPLSPASGQARSRPAPPRAEGPARSRSSRSSSERSRAGSRAPGGGSRPVRSPAESEPRRAAGA